MSSSSAPSFHCDVEALDDEQVWMGAVPAPLGESLSDWERHLRCTICKEFYVHPTTLLPCGHSFCSECIRTFLARQRANKLKQDGCSCPVCRAPVDKDPSKSLVHNPTLVALGNAFASARPHLLRTLRSNKAAATDKTTATPTSELVAPRDADESASAAVATLRLSRSTRRAPAPPGAAHSSAASSATTTKRCPATTTTTTMNEVRLPARLDHAKPDGLRKLCQQYGLDGSGSEVELRKRLKDWELFWNSRCGSGDPTVTPESTLCAFVERERQKRLAARQDAKLGHHPRAPTATAAAAGGDGQRLNALLKDPHFRANTQPGFAHMVAELRERRQREKELREREIERAKRESEASTANASTPTASDPSSSLGLTVLPSSSSESSSPVASVDPSSPPEDVADSGSCLPSPSVPERTTAPSPQISTGSPLKRKSPAQPEVAPAAETFDLCQSDADDPSEDGGPSGTTAPPPGPATSQSKKSRITSSLNNGPVTTAAHRKRRPSHPVGGEWVCPQCTLRNTKHKSSRAVCEACCLVRGSDKYHRLQALAEAENHRPA